jgi:predicted small secreted protein
MKKMKRTISAILSLALIGMLLATLVGCGQDIKAENEKLKAEAATLKSDLEKAKGEVQKLKEDVQKAAEKDATIGTLTTENEGLKKQLEDMKAQMAKPARKK